MSLQEVLTNKKVQTILEEGGPDIGQKLTEAGSYFSDDIKNADEKHRACLDASRKGRPQPTGTNMNPFDLRNIKIEGYDEMADGYPEGSKTPVEATRMIRESLIELSGEMGLDLAQTGDATKIPSDISIMSWSMKEDKKRAGEKCDHAVVVDLHYEFCQGNPTKCKKPAVKSAVSSAVRRFIQEENNLTGKNDGLSVEQSCIVNRLCEAEVEAWKRVDDLESYCDGSSDIKTRKRLDRGTGKNEPSPDAREITFFASVTGRNNMSYIPADIQVEGKRQMVGEYIKYMMGMDSRISYDSAETARDVKDLPAHCSERHVDDALKEGNVTSYGNDEAFKRILGYFEKRYNLDLINSLEKARETVAYQIGLAYKYHPEEIKAGDEKFAKKQVSTMNAAMLAKNQGR